MSERLTPIKKPEGKPTPIGRIQAKRLTDEYRLICKGFGIVADPKNPICNSQCGLLFSHCLNVKRFKLREQEVRIKEEYHKGNFFMDETWVALMQEFDFDEFDETWLDTIQGYAEEDDPLTADRILSGITKHHLPSLKSHDHKLPELLLERVLNHPRIHVVKVETLEDGSTLEYYGTKDE